MKLTTSERTGTSTPGESQQRSSRLCTPRPPDSAVGRGPDLGHNSRQARLQRQLHWSLEPALCRRSAGGVVRPLRRTGALQSDRSDRGPRAGLDDETHARATGPRTGPRASWRRELGGISHMTVTRIWAKHALKPHRLEGYLASNDPDFEAKAADVIGLYLHPPQHAAVFCVDEKTAIQALDRKDPVLPLSPGRAERHGFEYCPSRHALPVRRVQYQDRRGVGQDRRAPHLSRVRGLPDRPRGQPAQAAKRSM